MSFPNHEQIKTIAARFEKAWVGGQRPLISDFLSPDDPASMNALLVELINLDIQFRKRAGERPRSDDYLQLGSDAVQIACRELHESVDGSDTDKDIDETAFDPDIMDMTSGFSRVLESVAVDEVEAESTFIGPYKLLQVIGEGGMGSVWMAEQYEPVRRRVALKLIRADIGSKDMIARFEAERQACAMMDHQNIAKILDAGTTRTGNPYFVMELVNGIPLNKYCDNKKLDVRSRLELMIPVCRAIQHAHQKGIIHRDLKHSNVLVTQYDGQPVPKVIDFGLAKAFEQEQKLTDKTMFTEFGKVVGTLQYMSPEQAEMNNVDVDTRSDIYSLGVMTYKLLTGSTPLVNEMVTSHSVMQLLELIREGESPRPSVRLDSLDEEKLASIAEKRNSKPEKLKAQVQGDLDWIVMKALEKDRSRRYETANGMARDIERYLANEEVSACPPTSIYRLQKFYQRNQGLVVSMAVLSVALLLGTIGTSVGFFQARSQRDRANAESTKNIQLAKNERAAAREAELAKGLAESAKAVTEVHLYATKIKSSWADWQLGNVETAWKMLNDLSVAHSGWESQFLRTEFSASEKTLYGHALRVLTVDASPDGKWIATASNDGTVRIWDAKTGEMLHVCEIQDTPRQVRFSPDSSMIACVDRANLITSWESESGQLVATFGPFPEDLTSIAFIDQGTRMVVGSDGRDTRTLREELVERADGESNVPVVRVLETSDGKVLSQLKGHTERITDVDGSPDGKIVVSCSLDQTIRIWKKAGDQYVAAKTLVAHPQGVLQVAISPTEPILASCGKDLQIRIWDLDSGSFIKSFVGHRDAVTALRFSSDGKRIVSASADQTARVWNLDGEELLICKGHFDEVAEACFSSDDAKIFTAAFDNTVKVWNARNNPSTLVVKPHTQVIWGADFSPDGSRVVSGSQDGSIAITNLRTGEFKKLAPFAAPTSIMTLDHSPVANLFATGDDLGKLRIFSSMDGTLMKEIDAHVDYVWDVSFSAEGKRLATTGNDHNVCIWNTKDWSLIQKFAAHDQPILCARFSDDGRFVVTCGDDRLVKLWDAATFSLLHLFEGHQTPVWRSIFSSNGEMIASSSLGGEIILWDVSSRQQIRTIDAHQLDIAGLTFSQDDSRIVSSSDDATIKVWDVENGIELFVLRDTEDTEITHVSFSPDGSKLVSGNRNYVTIRMADDFEPGYKIFLRQDAEKLSADGIVAVTSGQATVADFEREMAAAEKCCRYFPSYNSLTVLGIAQYRLGRYADAVESLKQARRQQKIIHDYGDLRPFIEGYLALAHLQNGQVQLASQVREVFTEKATSSFFQNDPSMKELLSEVKQVFEEQTTKD